MTSTRTRTGAMKKNPVPVVRINGNLRFRKVDVETWLAQTAPAGWRAEAVRALLHDAPPAARDHFRIAPDGSTIQVACALIVATRA